MKPLILISILLGGGLIGLIIPRIQRREPGIAPFLISDTLLSLTLFYGLNRLYPPLSYLSILFLYLYILSLHEEDKEGAFRYISLGLLAISSILTSLFILPEEYHPIPVTAGVVVSIFSFLNLTLLGRQWHLPIYDRIMLYTLYIKIPSLGIALLAPIYYPTFKNLLFLQPLSSLLFILSGYGVLFKGRLFRFRVRPSPEFLWRSLILIALMVYGVVLSLLDRYPLEGVIPFYSRLILISAFAILSTVILLSRKARLSIRSFLFRHLYSTKYDLNKVLREIFALSERSEGGIPYFAKGVVRYLFEMHPFSGVALEVSTPDEDVKEALGMREGTLPHLIFTNEIGPSKTTITFFNRDGFDEDDRLNLGLISGLISRITSDMYLLREKVFKEKLMVAERVKLFILHDLKNICQTLKLLERNIFRLKQSEAGEFFSDLSSTLPHLVRRAEKILNTLKSMGRDLKSLPKEGSTPSVFSLREAIEEISKGLGEISNPSLKIDLKGDDRVYAEREMIMVAIENILKNALDKSFEEKGIEVRIEGRREASYYSLSISDTGTPIPEDTATRLFEPFFTTKRGGIGIGLYQAREAIKSQGGSITLKNSKEGVSFIIKIPAIPYQELSNS